MTGRSAVLFIPLLCMFYGGSFCPAAAEEPEGWLLLPAPRHFTVSGQMKPVRLHMDSDTLAGLPAPVQAALSQAAAAFAAAADGEPAGRYLSVHVSIDPERMPERQGYHLVLNGSKRGRRGRVDVVAHDGAGAFYAVQTLRQLASFAGSQGTIPLCEIQDWPDFPNRGVMLDIARDKVPEMKTLYALVDMMASWKYNQLQLYTEHTFAYRGHHVVWQDASPMTPAQVRDLDAYCQARYIELVPNQNSFGHMGRWLSHPEHAALAETPGGSDLSPVAPGSIELLRSMYASMLPHFSSGQFNVGCDETWSLGQGQSEAAAAARGVGRVYLEFLLQIRELLAENGKTMQFWADIINNHPDLIPELPKDMVAMEWGYEANHPFAEHAERFHEHGVRFYVVPGTSSWNSLLGRTDNALENLRVAAAEGLRFGSEGFLITDWGDGGHWQFLPISYLPYAYGAAVSWCYERNRELDAAAAASRYAFEDAAGIMGQIAYDLGNAHLQTGGTFGNNTTFSLLLQHHLERPLSESGLDQLRAEDLDASGRRIDELLERLDETKMQRADAQLIQEEFRMNAALAKFACRLGAARLRAGGVVTSALSEADQAGLAEELEALLDDYRQLWLARNRSGGLKDSAGRLERILTLLRQ